MKLKVEKRELKEKLPNNLVAAVVYGPGVESRSLKLNLNEFIKIYASAGESNLIKIEEGSNSADVLVKGIQKHPVKNHITHIDFYQVDMSKTLTTEIPLNFIGESIAVKNKGGVLMKNLEELHVECLPGDLVDHFDVDLSLLVDIGKGLQIKDLQIPAGIKVLNDINDSIAIVIEPQVDKGDEAREKEAAEAKAEDKKEEVKK